MVDTLAARSVIDFPAIGRYLDRIKASLAAHDLTVRNIAGGFEALACDARAEVLPGPGTLTLRVHACDPAAFNRLKHSLTGLIAFTARAENLTLSWHGDKVGPTLPPDLRVLTLADRERITPHCLRLRFKGEDLARFDDVGQLHGRLIMHPHGGPDARWPMLDDEGLIVWPDAGHPFDTRLFTIRHVDPRAGILTIDAARHQGAGRAPARNWLETAEPGATAAILGPAAHGLAPARHYVLAGDETALPAIARMLENLPATARGAALIEIPDDDGIQPLDAPDGMSVRWLSRHGAPAGTTALLEDAVRGLDWPQDLEDTFFWCGCEFDAYLRIRRHLQETVRLPAARQVMFAFWRKGMSEPDIVAAGADAIAP